MRVRCVFVPPGGGEADYSLEFDMPSVPQPGDYILVSRAGKASELENFIVRRTWWQLDYPDNDISKRDDDSTVGKTDNFFVECEFARGPYSSESHKNACNSYEAKGKRVQEFDESAY